MIVQTIAWDWEDVKDKYEEAKKLLTWDSNRNDLWELDWKLKSNKI